MTVVTALHAFIDVTALHAVTRVASDTAATEATHCVTAVSCRVTPMPLLCTLVHVHTATTISRIPTTALALEATWSILACRVAMTIMATVRSACTAAWWSTVGTLICVATPSTVAQVTKQTLTRERAIGVGTVCVVMAVTRAL